MRGKEEQEDSQKVAAWNKINEIVQRGSCVEIKKNSDGSWKVMETVRHIVKAD